MTCTPPGTVGLIADCRSRRKAVQFAAAGLTVAARIDSCNTDTLALGDSTALHGDLASVPRRK